MYGVNEWDTYSFRMAQATESIVCVRRRDCDRQSADVPTLQSIETCCTNDTLTFVSIIAVTQALYYILQSSVQPIVAAVVFDELCECVLNVQ